MRKIVSLFLLVVLCVLELSACIQIVTPAPQQATTVTETTVVPSVQTPQVQETQPVSPIQQTLPPQQVPPIQQVPPVKPSQSGYTMPQFSITLDQAKNVALNAVGLDERSVTFTKQKQDYDDGMPEYEITFVANELEYEFEISGVNGAILSQEIESIYD